MSDAAELAAWVEGSIAKVGGDVDRARSLVRDAMGQLFKTFDELRVHLVEERAQYEGAVEVITGGMHDAGLVRAIRDILQRFVDDMVNISRSSVRILMEVETLRGHADEVAGRGHRIEKIAQATRVISLNAGIEARRVGAAGGVFRVVADEIKRLANETGELSKAIRGAIELQAKSLGEVHGAAAHLAATDLDAAVKGHKDLDATVARLEAVSRTSSKALERIQADVDVAIRALQFEDMVTQLLDAIGGKLAAIRAVCGQVAGGDLSRASLHAAISSTDKRIHRDAVAQHSVTAGDVELF